MFRWRRLTSLARAALRGHPRARLQSAVRLTGGGRVELAAGSLIRH